MIIYELDIWWQDLSAGFTLKDCLFGAVKLTKNTDQDKFSYSEYGTGLYSRSLFSIPNFDYGTNFVLFGVDKSSPVHIDNKKKDI